MVRDRVIRGKLRTVLTCATARRGLVAALALALLAAAASFVAPVGANGQSAPPSLGAELRYIGRDTVTGLPARVDDRFIAQVEEDVARYGLDEREPVPPPAPRGVEPVAISVAALGIDQPVMRLGLDAFGRLDVPQDAVTVGWHPAFSTLPGEGGTTFFAAHYEYGGVPGTFYELSALSPGDRIEVRMGDGSSATYEVASVLDYDLAVVDMGAILQGVEGVESVSLMTCSGPIREGNYQERTLVLAVRAG